MFVMYNLIKCGWSNLSGTAIQHDFSCLKEWEHLLESKYVDHNMFIKGKTISMWFQGAENVAIESMSVYRLMAKSGPHGSYYGCQ